MSCGYPISIELTFLDVRIWPKLLCVLCMIASMGERGNINNDGFRDLAPELTNRFASTAYELMDQDEAYDFIANVWAERDMENEIECFRCKML